MAGQVSLLMTSIGLQGLFVFFGLQDIGWRFPGPGLPFVLVGLLVPFSCIILLLPLLLVDLHAQSYIAISFHLATTPSIAGLVPGAFL